MDYLNKKEQSFLESIESEASRIVKIGETDEGWAVAVQRLHKEAASNLPDSRFAQPIIREYPMGDPDQLVLSYLHCRLSKQANKLALSILERNIEALDLQDVQELADIMACKLDKSASSAAKKYALPNFQRTENDTPVDMYPINNENEIGMALEQLSCDQHLMSGLVFKHASMRVYRSAQEIGWDMNFIPSNIKASGEDRVPNPSKQNLFLIKSARQSRYKDPEALDVLDSILDGLTKHSSDEDACWELCAAIEQLDLSQGIQNHQLASNTPLDSNPYLTIFSGTRRSDLEKFASVHALMEMGDGEHIYIPLRSMQKIVESDVINRIPNTLAELCKEAARHKTVEFGLVDKLQALHPSYRLSLVKILKEVEC